MLASDFYFFFVFRVIFSTIAENYYNKYEMNILVIWIIGLCNIINNRIIRLIILMKLTLPESISVIVRAI